MYQRIPAYTQIKWLKTSKEIKAFQINFDCETYVIF
jgi:hypothetical protein